MKHANQRSENTAEAFPAQLSDLFGELARATAGQLRPRYVLVPRSVGELACGDLVIEPALGPARVAATRPSFTTPRASRQIDWQDDQGTSRASGAYLADLRLQTRQPAKIDCQLIQRSIDQAARSNREISADAARLIAAHLHRGHQSALHEFAVTGTIRDGIFNELDVTWRSPSAYVRAWSEALTSYCVGQDDFGPRPRWAEAAALKTKPEQHRAEVKPTPAPAPLDDSILKLLDAAFYLGFAVRTGHPDPLASKHLTRLLQQAKRGSDYLSPGERKSALKSLARFISPRI
ncbi:hypothetical protein [Micromonospora sp. NPDC005172]|uniref:hypothetical protein n=1 Tax=Micromonospora sp. NPDC005172 TaxID=3156867 RepID=UPI0033A684AF